MAHFHEGIDIAALQRDRSGRPLDKAYAVADGVVGYINRVAGKSNYGKYVVLLHHDPVGEVYTLYGHLAEVEKHLSVGQNVSPGQVLGQMGNTSSAGIPMERAHLHFEIGLICNAHFAEWYRAKKLKPDHGNFNGHNFFGANPRDAFADRRQNPDFTFQSHLALLPTAFEVILAASKRPEFFDRYPSLWQGPEFDGGPMVVDCTENGLPLKGRRATDSERAMLGGQRSAVLMADEKVLGRNGCRLVVNTPRGWKIGQSGVQWLEVLEYY